MTTYLQFHEDDRGDLVDITYWHGFCAPPEVRALGEWPCPESVDYTVYCGEEGDTDNPRGCHERVTSVGLTDAGLVYTIDSGHADELMDWEIERAREKGWLPAEDAIQIALTPAQALLLLANEYNDGPESEPDAWGEIARKIRQAAQGLDWVY